MNKEPGCDPSSPAVGISSTESDIVETDTQIASDATETVSSKDVHSLEETTADSSVPEIPIPDDSTPSEVPVIDSSLVAETSPSIEINSVELPAGDLSIPVTSIENAPAEVLVVDSTMAANTKLLSEVDTVEKFSSTETDSMETIPSPQVEATESAESDTMETISSTDVETAVSSPSSDSDSVEITPSTKIDTAEEALSSDIETVEIIPSSETDNVEMTLSTGIDNVEEAPSLEMDTVDTIASDVIDTAEEISSLESNSVEAIPSSDIEKAEEIPSTENEIVETISSSEVDTMERILLTEDQTVESVPSTDTDTAKGISATENDTLENSLSTESNTIEKASSTDIDENEELSPVESNGENVPSAEVKEAETVCSDESSKEMLLSSEADTVETIPSTEIDMVEVVPSTDIDKEGLLPSTESIIKETIPPSNKEAPNTNKDIDQTKVDVAARFLSNFNVAGDERDNKEAFLESKGLSRDEIELAFRRAADFADPSESLDDSWGVFSYVKSVVVGAGILAAANYAYKSYVLPYLAKQSKDESRLEQLAESFQAVKDDIKQNTYELTGTLKQMQSLMEDHQKCLKTITTSLQKDPSDASDVASLKTELSTIKSMMLSRNQFPATPFTTLIPKVNEIPAWQRISKETEKNKKADPPESNSYSIFANAESIENAVTPTKQETQESAPEINDNLPAKNTLIESPVLINVSPQVSSADEPETGSESSEYENVPSNLNSPAGRAGDTPSSINFEELATVIPPSVVNDGTEVDMSSGSTASTETTDKPAEEVSDAFKPDDLEVS